MEIDILKKAGLTESQAKGYLALIENGELTPNELAQITGETRTNAYAIVDKLVSFGLATKKDSSKAIYIANHPSTVETLAERRRKALVKNEQEVKRGISPLVDLFYAHNELPGTRVLQGIEGIKEVYADTLRTKKDIYLVRTTADVPDLGLEFLEKYREKRAATGIHTYGITTYTKYGHKASIDGTDEAMLFIRTFIPDNSYTAPVEIDIYGDKVAFISFGETQMATIINSPTIAEAMRQIIKIVSSQFATLRPIEDTGLVPAPRQNL